MCTSPDTLINTRNDPWMPLDPDVEEIRILRLTPGEFDDDIVVSLHKADLEDQPQYDALSYVWGKELALRQAIVNGHKVTIGLFLDTALRYLRNSLGGEDRVLWVDALCINQKDVNERNHQVQLMRGVYSTAQNVLIWLGPEEPDDHIALDYIKISHDEVFEPPDEVMRSFKSLGQICQRPWFGRLWVVQECVLSKEDPILCFGDRTASWSDFNRHIDRLIFRTDDPDKSLDSVVSSTARAWILDGMRKNPSQNTLFHRVFHSIDCEATDPRDKIFGLLGISYFPPDQPVLTPDYSMTVSEVYAKATFTMLRARDDIYSWFPLPSMHTTDSAQTQNFLDLPSWACDFSVDSKTESTRLDPRDLVPRTGKEKLASLSSDDQSAIPPSWLSTDGKALTAVGSYIGTITETTGDHCVGGKALNWITAHILETIQNDIPLSYIINKERQSSEENIDIRPYQHTDDKIREIFGRSDAVLFLTENGRIGATYHPDPINGVRPGDIVVGMFSINHPIILRQVPGTSTTDRLYNMINVTYIVDHTWGHASMEEFLHKFQDGAEPPTVSDFEQLGLTKYTIV